MAKSTVAFSLLGIFLFACFSNASLHFDNYMTKHGLAFEGEEYHSRLNIFEKKVKEIEAHNSNPDRSYDMAVNKFSHFTTEELINLGGAPSVNHQIDEDEFSLHKRQVRTCNDTEFPASVDWRQQNAISHVKYQGQCGVCWAFAAAASIEGAWWKKTNQLVSVAEEQFLDCFIPKGTNKCKKSIFTQKALYWANRTGMIEDALYPFTYGDPAESCKTLPRTVTVHAPVSLNNGFGSLKHICTMKRQVAKGPTVTVQMIVDKSFFSYTSGIYDIPKPEKCKVVGQHALLVVGYGTENGQDYWIIKNSWGKDWGEKGFFRIAMGKNLCGVEKTNTWYIPV